MIQNEMIAREPTKVFALKIHHEMVQKAKDDPAVAEMVLRIKKSMEDFKGSVMILPADVMSDGKPAFEVLHVEK